MKQNYTITFLIYCMFTGDLSGSDVMLNYSDGGYGVVTLMRWLLYVLIKMY